MFQLEAEINRQIALSLAKKRGPWAKYAKGKRKKLKKIVVACRFN